MQMARCDVNGDVLSPSSTKIFLPMMHSSDVLSDRAVLQFCKQIIAVRLQSHDFLLHSAVVSSAGN